MSDRRSRTIAIVLAVVAVAISAAAVVVVVRREEPAAIEEHRVAARDVASLTGRREDPALWRALGLRPGDELAAIAGVSIKIDGDVAAAIIGAAMTSAHTIDVDLVRDGKPVLVRWRLDHELRNAVGHRREVPRSRIAELIGDLRASRLDPALGLEPGDVVRAINGYELATPDLLDKVKSAPALTIDVMRRGEAAIVTIPVR